MPCERKCDPDQSKTGWGWIPERCPWTPSGGMGARRRLPTVATVMDHNALRGDPLLHHQSRLSQKERVAGVQLTPIIRSLSDPRASCPWCACNTSAAGAVTRVRQDPAGCGPGVEGDRGGEDSFHVSGGSWSQCRVPSARLQAVGCRSTRTVVSSCRGC